MGLLRWMRSRLRDREEAGIGIFWPDAGCCALDDGHDGPCAWVCRDCDGAGCEGCVDGLVSDG